jgi:hypothetical protein
MLETLHYAVTAGTYSVGVGGGGQGFLAGGGAGGEVCGEASDIGDGDEALDAPDGACPCPGAAVGGEDIAGLR